MMLLELMPTIEFCIDFKSFHNIDLCHRGFYQIRSQLKLASKFGQAKIDINIPRSTAPNLFPASIVDGQAVGKTIEILYAHEIVQLDDQINFTVKLPTRIDKLPTWLEFVANLELWFIEKDKMLPTSSGSDIFAAFRCVSSRRLVLRLSLSRGIHWHRPIVFDYYHLAVVTITVHASLVGLESKWKKIKKAYHSSERDQKGTESPAIYEKLSNYHKNACKVLLSAYEALQLRIRSYSRLFPSTCEIRIQMVDTMSKLDALCRRVQGEPDPWVALDQDRILLSQELLVLWHQFLELFRSCSKVMDFLATEHHNTRVKRFAEGFFCSEDTVQSLVSCGYSSSSQSLGLCARLVEMLKRSSYFAQLPQLPIGCDEIDGTGVSMPIIFEEMYLPPSLSKQASRLPSVTLTDNQDQNVTTAGRRRSSSKLSPEKVLRALKSSFCLDLKNTNKPAIRQRALEADGSMSNGTLDEVVEIELERRPSDYVDDKKRGPSPAPVYLSVDSNTFHRCSTEPNLVQQRERETNFLESVIGRASSETDIGAVQLLLSDTACAPVTQRSTNDNDEANTLEADLNVNQTVDSSVNIVTKSQTEKVDVSPSESDESVCNMNEITSPAEPAVGQLTAAVDATVVEFVRSKEQFKERLSVVGYNGHLCSDFQYLPSKTPFFANRSPQIDDNIHLIICVHGLDGNKDDLDPYKTYLRLYLADENAHFLMSESNQNSTFNDFETMSRNFVDEILLYLSRCSSQPKRISIIAHSLGNIIVRAALADPRLSYLESRWHCYLSLNAPHLGVLYNQKAASWGVSLVQWWKRSKSLEQLMLRDQHSNGIRDSFIYRLSDNSSLACFKYVLLVGSSQDTYVPCHSALIQPCKAAQKDPSETGSVYGEMVTNLLTSLSTSARCTTVLRYTAFHGMAGVSRTHQVMGRAAHIAVLDDDLFIEKFLSVSALRYFI